MMDIMELTKRGLELYKDFKEKGELSFCCLKDEVLFLLNMLLQMAKNEGLKVEVKIKLKEEGKNG